MLIGGWEIRLVRNFDSGLEMAAISRRPLGAFYVRGHSFSLYGLTVSRQTTFYPAVHWPTTASGFVCLRNFSVIEFPYKPS